MSKVGGYECGTSFIGNRELGSLFSRNQWSDKWQDMYSGFIGTNTYKGEGLWWIYSGKMLSKGF